jgi:hypothetical protein
VRAAPGLIEEAPELDADIEAIEIGGDGSPVGEPAIVMRA